MDVLHQKNLWIGFVLAAFGTLLFSLKSIFIKFLYQQGLDADSVLVLRMALALPIYSALLFWLLRCRSRHAKLNFSILRTIFLLGFLGYYLASLLDLKGLELITAQLERLSLFTYPFMVAVIGFFLFNEPLTRRLMISLIITYTGLWVVMGQELQLTDNNVLTGVALVLGSALSFSLYVLFSKGFIKQLGSPLFTSLAMIASSIFGLIHGVVVLDWAALTISTSAWLWLVMLVVFSTVIPSFMMTEAINRIGPAQTGVMGMLGPIFTIVLAVHLLDEPFTLAIAFGGLLILLGVMGLVAPKAN
ncbi:MAG: DMT family transporter [Piscirickettsiaceae bacterium]|nr:DMT family transporter [Piscirickettsiaceae bacterium]